MCVSGALCREETYYITKALKAITEEKKSYAVSSNLGLHIHTARLQRLLPSLW